MARFDVIDKLQLPDDLPLDYVYDGLFQNSLKDLARGGMAIQDPSQGLNVQDWLAEAERNEIYVGPRDGSAARTLIVSESENVSWVSLAFDTLMQVYLAYIAGDTPKLRWFDTTQNSIVTDDFPDIITPILMHDDVRKKQVDLGGTDIVFVYVRDDALRVRYQRDRFGDEKELAPMPEGADRIVGYGMTGALRLRFDLGRRLR